MPAAKKPAVRSDTSTAARARAQSNEQALDKVMKSLDAAQKDLASLGGSVGTGVRDLRRDLNRLLRDARRDVVKMQKSIQRDLGRLQKDLSAAAKATPAAARQRATTGGAKPAPSARQAASTAKPAATRRRAPTASRSASGRGAEK
jgi:hypothetical protein